MKKILMQKLIFVTFLSNMIFSTYSYCRPYYACFIMFNVDRPKGKAPVGGVSIFGAVTDGLTGGSTSIAPEPSTITTAPATTKPVSSTVSVTCLVNNLMFFIAHIGT